MGYVLDKFVEKMKTPILFEEYETNLMSLVIKLVRLFLLVEQSD